MKELHSAKTLYLIILIVVSAMQAKGSGPSGPAAAPAWRPPAMPALQQPPRQPPPQPQDTVYKSETLVIRKLSAHSFQHISYLQTADFGKVPCNGMIVIRGREAIVFDTPADSGSSAALIRYLSGEKQLKIKAVVATHFHADCVAGLQLFHQHNVPSYANNATISRLRQSADSIVIPGKGFDQSLELTVGGKKVQAAFFGEGHTKDNIVGWYGEDRVLFGGCLIKETGAGEGNLDDANVNAWSETVKKVKKSYPRAAIVIPGHGEPGGRELLDYTTQLFAGY